MIVVQMNERSSSLDIARVCDHQERRGMQIRVVPGRRGSTIVCEGHSETDLELKKLPSVKAVSRTNCPYPLASLEVSGPQGPVQIGRGLSIGGGSVAVMAGPCSVESREQLLETARGVASSGASVLRGGAFKPRSNPYSFQGLGSQGIDLLLEAREDTGLPIVTEVMSPEDVEWLAPQVDILQVGTRSMQNFPLLKALGRVDTPVLLKRGMASTVDEWLQAAEYILAGGNSRVILCERGIRSFDKSTRNTLDLSIVPLVKSLTHLPVVVDPSHATGKRHLVAPMSLAALAAGADGLIVEVHSRPEEALCDGPQSLDLPAFDGLMNRISRLMEALEPEESEWGLKVAM
jgi:3-deoxy-7-phosphoheptulonate synthase